MSCEFSPSLAEFALGSLESEERDRVAAHLEECEECAAETGAYLGALSAVVLANPTVEPPREGRERLRAAIHTSAAPTPIATRRLIGLRWLIAAAAIALIGLVASLYLEWQLGAQQSALAQLTDRSRRYDTVVSVLTAEKMALCELNASTAAPGARGRLFLDHDSGSGMMMHRLPPIDESNVYQLWFVSEGRRVSGGLLRSNPDGTGYTIIQAPGPVNQFDSVGVTREPAGGSAQPTTERLLGATL